MRAFILLASVLALLSCARPSLESRRLETNDPRARALQGDGAPRKVLLITVAGLQASDFLDASGYAALPSDAVRMPNLAGLAAEGAVGLAVSTPSPGSVYASHATIATGRLPNRHGVIADWVLDPETHQPIRFWDNRLLAGTALWDAAIGRGVIALDWPTTAGARVEWLVPALGPADEEWLGRLRSVSTPALMRDLEEVASLDEEERDENREQDAPPLPPWPSPAERDRALAELACRTIESERDPGLWLLRLTQSGVAMVESGPGSLAAKEALAGADRALGLLLHCLETSGQLAETAIFVVGDVAYRSVHTRIAANGPLVRAGLIGRDPRSASGLRSWLARVRSHGRSAYIYAQNADHAIEAREILEREAEITGAFRVVSAGDLARAGADPQAWFGLIAEPGYVFEDDMIGPVIAPARARGAAGGLRFEGPSNAAETVGFVAWGRGIRPGLRVPDMALEDVAPTIAMLVGLRLEDDVQGEPIVGLLRAAIPPPPPGPKRIGVGSEGKAERMMKELRGKRHGERREKLRAK